MQFSTVFLLCSLNSGFRASPKETALAAIMCINGPPWVPGKMALSIDFAYFSLHKIIPPRGPRKVLCVVVVTKSAKGTGFGCKPLATSPAMCAMSTIKYASTESAICLNFSKFIVLG